MLEFEYPYVFLLLPLFIYGAFKLKPREDALLISGLWGDGLDAKNYLSFLKWLGIIFLLFALASPVSKEEFFPDRKPAHAIIMCLDLSASMGYPMEGGLKIKVAKKLAKEFIQKRKDDHIGLVGFADFAYMATPLTYDVKAVSEVISRLGLGDGTALRDGIFMAMRMLKKSEAKEKIVIALTDGEDTASQMPTRELLRMIKKEGVKIYTIGVGSGRSLKYLSVISGGRSYQAQSADALKNVYEQIDRLEKTDLEVEKIVQSFYYYQYPLFLSVLFFVLFLYVKVRRGN